MPVKPGLSPEAKLLLLCSRVELDAGDADELDALLRERLDWPLIVRHAESGGIAPLLFKQLSSADRAARIPTETMAALREAYRLQSIRSLRILGLTGRIVDALGGPGLPVILLKGVYLAAALYTDAALRPMCDIDLLCRPEDERRIRERLSGLGFDEPPVANKSAVHERIVFEHRNHLPRFLSARDIPVELHIRLFSGFFRPEENLADIWRNARPCDWNGRTVLALSPEDLLAHLVTHLYQHLAQTGSLMLYWLCDLHELIRSARPAIDWELFLARIDSLGCRNEAGAILELLRQHWHTPIPEPVLSGLPAGAALFDLASLLQGKSGKPELLVQFRRSLIRNLAATQGRRAVLVYLFRTVWPSREFITARYQLASAWLVFPYTLRFAAALSSHWLRTALTGAIRSLSGHDAAR